jgi:hypothetical protein
MEIEADHIGMMLLGAAGFDPQTAPMVFEKMGKIARDSSSSLLIPRVRKDRSSYRKPRSWRRRCDYIEKLVPITNTNSNHRISSKIT